MSNTPNRGLRMPDSLWDPARAKAARRGETITDVIARALADYITGADHSAETASGAATRAELEAAGVDPASALLSSSVATVEYAVEATGGGEPFAPGDRGAVITRTVRLTGSRHGLTLEVAAIPRDQLITLARDLLDAHERTAK